MKKERLKIGGIHFSISILLVALCLSVVLGIWYPNVMPTLFGIGKVLVIFVVANLAIFPALSALICKEDKKEQKRDLTILALLQIAIASVMVYFLFQMRPLWSAFVVDSFEIVRAKDIQPDERPPSPMADISLFTPFKMVGASFSDDPEIAKEQKNNDLAGKSVAWYPSAIVPLAEKMELLKKYAQPLSNLKKYNREKEVETVLAKYPQATGYFPLKGYVKDGAVLTNQDFTWFQPVSLWPWEDDSALK